MIPLSDTAGWVVSFLHIASTCLGLPFVFRVSRCINEHGSADLPFDLVLNRNKVAKDRKVPRPLNIQLSPEKMFPGFGVQFEPDLPASELVSIINELEEKILHEHESVGRIFIEV